MTAGDVLDLAGAAAVLLGAFLCFTAAVGLVRFPDVLSRMHAATKPQVLGLMLVALGLALVLREARASAILVLVVLAQMLTAPVAGHMVGRASYRAGQVRDDLLSTDELTGELVDGSVVGRDDRGAP